MPGTIAPILQFREGGRPQREALACPGLVPPSDYPALGRGGRATASLLLCWTGGVNGLRPRTGASAGTGIC